MVAPVDGHVTHLVLQTGDMVSPDHPAVAIVDGHAWRVEANYKEYYLRHLKPGHTAWVWLDAHPWRLYPARIQGIAHGISREQGGEALMPYVSPSVDWIRLQRRPPVRIILQDLPGVDGLHGIGCPHAGHLLAEPRCGAAKSKPPDATFVRCPAAHPRCVRSRTPSAHVAWAARAGATEGHAVGSSRSDRGNGFLRLDDLSWAAFSGYMVMRADIAELIPPVGPTRTAGTIGGAVVSLLLAPTVADTPVLLMLGLFAVSWIGTFQALTSRYSYAWLFFGLTAGMVMTEALAAPANVVHFAGTRVAEIMVVPVRAWSSPVYSPRPEHPWAPVTPRRQARSPGCAMHSAIRGCGAWTTARP